MTTLPSLHELYATHQGKVSDKWDLYLDVYDRIFAPFRERPVRLLEIGVQNGGSLEIWSKFFPAHTAIVGVDINPKCGELRFDNPRIEVLVGSISAPQIAARVMPMEPFDIIIDDGSHTSNDILVTAASYVHKVKPGGLFVVEDMHCNYSANYQGGLLRQGSSMGFFKKAIDALYGRMWAVPVLQREYFADFFGSNQPPAWLFDGSLARIEFHDSMIVLERTAAGASTRVNRRIVAGRVADVEPNVPHLPREFDPNKI